MEATVPLFEASDLARAVLFLLLAPLAWGLPARDWPAACRLLASAWTRVRVFQNPQWRAVVSAALGERRVGLPAGAIRERVLATNIEFMLQQLRMAGPGFGRWRPEVELVGRENIDDGLRRGRGIVLWVHRFRPFVHFVALRNAGFHVCRPSGRYHGEFYRSRIGRFWLNPLQTAIEDRYCERVGVEDHNIAHLRELMRRLNRNAVLCMYADHIDGTRNMDLPFLGGRLSLSTQPVRLALENNSQLLPVFPVSDTAGNFRVRVEPALDISAIGDHRTAVEAAMARHAERLEWYVLEYPDQWHGWWRVRTDIRPT